MLAVDWTEKCRPSSHHSSISLAYIKSSNSSYNISRHWNLKPQICHRLWLANKWGWWRRCRGRCLPKNVLPPPESSSYDHFQRHIFLLGRLAFHGTLNYLRNSYDVLCFNPAKHKFSCGFGSAESSLKSVPIWGKWSIGLWSNHLWRTEMRCWILIYIQEIMWGSQRKKEEKWMRVLFAESLH